MNEQLPSKDRVAELQEFWASRIGSQKGQFRMKHADAGMLFTVIDDLRRELATVTEERNEAAATVATWMESCTGKHGSQSLCVDGCSRIEPPAALTMEQIERLCSMLGHDPIMAKDYAAVRSWFDSVKPTPPPRAQPYVAAAAGRVSNQVKLHNEDDQFTTDLRVLVAHAVGECDRCPDERQRGCKHCCWCSSSLTKGEG